jgi:hypothetical protein
MIYLIGIAAILLVVAYKKGLFDTEHEATQPAPVAQTLAGTYQGRVDMPSKERMIENRSRLLAERGIVLTGNDAVDNAATGGGGENGGVGLAGAFGFEADASGNIIKGEFILHGTRLPASGTVRSDGTFNGAANGAFNGSTFRTSITGEIHGGLGEEYHNGIMLGVFTPNGKL